MTSKSSSSSSSLLLTVATSLFSCLLLLLLININDNNHYHHNNQHSLFVEAQATNASNSSTANDTTLAPTALNPQLASSNGSYCECIFSLSLYCTQIKLVLVPFAGHEFSSDRSLDFTQGKWIFPDGKPLPRLALEWRTVVGNKLVPEIDGTLNASVRVSVGSRDGDGVIDAVATRVPRSGRYVFENIIIPRIDNTDNATSVSTAIRVNFTTAWGPFAVTPVIEIYRRPPNPTKLTSSLNIRVAYSQSLKNVIENPNRIVIGREIPDFTVSVVDVANQPLNLWDGDDMMVFASYFGLAQYPNFHFQAPIKNGVAFFTGVKFGSSIIPDTAMQLTFYTRIKGLPPYDPENPAIAPISFSEKQVTTGVFRVTTVPVNNEFFGFGSDEESFIYEGASMRSAVVGEPLPPIRVRAFDSSGRFDSTTQDGEVFIKVSSIGGSRIAFRGSTQALIQGKTDFADLSFSDWLADATGTMQPYQDVILFFSSVGRTQNGRMVGTTLYSMVFRVFRTYALAPTVVGARFINHPFYNPGFWYNGQVRQLVRNQVLPEIKLELFDSVGDRTTNSGVATVTVTADPPSTIAGVPTSATFVDGVARINNMLPFASPGTKVTLTFSVNAGGQRFWLHVYVIILADLQHCFDLRFARDYYSGLRLSEPSSFTSFQSSFKPIVVEVVDSNLQRDESCQSAVITARSKAQIGGTVAVVTNGRAVFPSLSFASLGRYQVEFSAADDIFVNLTGKSINTGSIDIEDVVVGKYALEFDPNGHVRFEGHTPAIAIGDTVPMIGVRVINTARQITPPVPGRVQIKVNCSRGCTLQGTQTQVITSDDGTAWFADLVLRDKLNGTDADLLVMPKLIFWAEVVNATQDAINAPPVVGSKFILKSGPLNVKPFGTQALALVLVDNLNIVAATTPGTPATPGTPTASNVSATPAATTPTTVSATSSAPMGSTTTLAPGNSSASNSTNTTVTPAIYNEPPGFSYVGDLLIVTSLRNTNIRFNVSTIIGTTVAIRGPGNSYYFPTSAAAQLITASSPSGITNGSTATLSNAYGTPPQAQFPILGLEIAPYIQDEITVMEFKNSLIEDSLVVGPFQNSELLFDPSLTVIVAEIKQSWTTFSYTRWSNHLSASLKIDSDRILRGRVSPGGGVTSGKTFTWIGVRVEFAFLPPTTRSSNKLSPRLLTEMFLAIEDQCTGLDMRKKYALVNESECDAFRLSQAVAASKRCIETSHPSLRCTCHMPFFRSMSVYCAESDTFGSVCAQLTTCKSPIITDSCSKFRAEIAASYARIFGILIAVIGFLVIFGLWVNGVFDQTIKAKLETKDEAGTIKRRTQDPDFYEAL